MLRACDEHSHDHTHPSMQASSQLQAAQQRVPSKLEHQWASEHQLVELGHQLLEHQLQAVGQLGHLLAAKRVVVKINQLAFVGLLVTAVSDHLLISTVDLVLQVSCQLVAEERVQGPLA